MGSADDNTQPGPGSGWGLREKLLPWSSAPGRPSFNGAQHMCAGDGGR